MQEKASSKKHEGLGVSAGETSQACSAPRSCPVGLGKGSRAARFTAVAFIACMLSLLLHLQRKYLGYFCRGDVSVWLHQHLHGFGEVRAARTSPRGGAERSHRPWGPAWVADEGGTAWCPEGQGGGSGRRHAPLLGFVGFGGSGGNSGAEPWEKGGVKCSGEVLMLSLQGGLKPVEDLFAFWLVLESWPSFAVGRAEGLIWSPPLPPCVLTSPFLELGLQCCFRKRQRREGKHWIPLIVAGFMSTSDKTDA